MTIHVTRRHIGLGLRNDCCSCPIALALAPLKPRLFVQVDGLAYGRFESSRIALPKIAMNFMKDFDARLEVQPISFNLSAECFMA